jgi:hypothetical protein
MSKHIILPSIVQIQVAFSQQGFRFLMMVNSFSLTPKYKQFTF